MNISDHSKNLRLQSFTSIEKKHFGKVLKPLGQDAEPGTFCDMIFVILVVKISNLEIANFLENSLGLGI